MNEVKKMTKIYGHRGSKGEYPENTLLGFQKAIDMGVEGLEIDVHLTKDGELVVIHDETLHRTTDGEGRVKDHTLAEMKQLSVGNQFKHLEKYEASWDKEKVPTLQEVLRLLDGTDVELNIELKTTIYTYPGIEEKLLQVVETYASKRKIVYSSFHFPTLMRIKRLDENAEIAWLLQQPIPQILDYISTFQLEALHLDKNLVLDMQSEFPPSLAAITRVWTVNLKEEMERLFQLGVEAIITDYPERAIEVKRSIAKVN